MNTSLFDNAHRQAQYEAMLSILAPGERVDYSDLLSRMRARGDNTDGIGLTLDDLSFRGYKQLWRRSEIVSYREPYFDHEHEGSWTEGTLWITRAEERDESLWR